MLREYLKYVIYVLIFFSLDMCLKSSSGSQKHRHTFNTFTSDIISASHRGGVVIFSRRYLRNIHNKFITLAPEHDSETTDTGTTASSGRRPPLQILDFRPRRAIWWSTSRKDTVIQTIKRVLHRVARWYIFIPKKPLWVYFWGPLNGKSWYILWPLVKFYDPLVYFVDIMYIFPRFGMLSQYKSAKPGCEHWCHCFDKIWHNTVQLYL
jgi:hypothetical protein